MALPPGWVIQQNSQNSRYFYHNENEKLDVWMRPVPPPGFVGDWPPLVRASHILVKSTESRSHGGPPVSKNFRTKGRIITRSKNKALQKIQKIREDIINEPHREHLKKFQELAATQSDCASSASGGDLGWFQPKDFVPEFVHALEELPYGEISEPFLSSSGWHIVIRTDGASFAPTSLFPHQLSILDAPPFEFEFQPFKDRQQRPNLSTKEKAEIYKNVFNAEANHTEESFRTLIQSLIKIESAPPIIYMHIKTFLFYHPTNQKVFDECHELVRKIIPSELPGFESEVLKYTCNPTYWKRFCNDKILQFRKVGFTYNFAGEWVNHIKGEKDPVEAINSLMHALTSGITYSDDLLKLAHEKMSMDCQGAPELRERVLQIDINRILEVIQRNQQYKVDFEGLMNTLISVANGEIEDPTEMYQRIVIAASHSPNETIAKYLTIIKENKQEVEKRKNFEKEHANDRAEISRNLFNESYPRTMILSADEPRFRRWMDYLEREKQMDEIIVDEEFYNDLIDFSYRLALTELWWIPSVWMKYWDFLHNTRPEEADVILSLAQHTFQNNALFELERADICLRDGKYKEAREIYASLMSRGEPLLTAAMTLDFRCVIFQQGETAALQSLTDKLDYVSVDFIMNTAKMCSNPEIAWSLYQLGIDKFNGNMELTLAAADFLASQRDMRNTRLLLQQPRADEKNEQLIITKKLFEFELEHLAPPDHLNETQKGFKSAYPFIQYMHRYRFKDLYPLNSEELITMAYLTHEFTIDYPKESTEYVTLLPPHGVPLENMRTRKEYENFYSQALQQLTAKQPKAAPTDPSQAATSISQYPRLTAFGDQLNGLVAPILDPDTVINEILSCKLHN